MRSVLRPCDLTIFWAAASLLFWSVLSCPAHAQTDKSPEVKGPAKDALPRQGQDANALPGQPARDEEFGFLQTWHGVRIGTALQMMAVPNPVSALSVRVIAASGQGNTALLMPDWELTLDEPLPLSSRLLAELIDGTPIPSVAKKPLSDLKADERAYYLITCQALINSRLVGPELFEKAGEKNRYVTFDHLWTQPDLYRGKVVPVIGRMIRLRRWEAPRLAQENGVEFFYEGWVVGPTAKRNPYCIVFTTLPEGLHEEEKMDRPVRFHGYYIKKFRYDAEDAKRVTHLLIGPTVYVEPVPPRTPTDSYFSKDVLIGTMIGLLGIAGLIALMTFWFRRGDRAIHSRLAALRDERSLNVEAEEKAERPDHPPDT